MNTAIIFTWTGIVPGHEKEALAFAVESNEYWEKKAAEGHCTKLEWFVGLSAPFRFTMVKGDYDYLVGLVVSDEFMTMMNKGYMLLEDFAHYTYFTDDLAEKTIGKAGEVMSQLGLV